MSPSCCKGKKVEQRRKNLVIVRFTLVLLFVRASVATPSPLTLTGFITDVVQQSPQLAAARHEAMAAAYDVTKKKGTTLPYLSGTLSGYEVNGRPVTPFTALNISDPENPALHQAHWGPVAEQGVSVSYPLFQNGSVLGLNNPPVVASANAVVDQQRFLAMIAEQKVILDAAITFCNSVWYQDELEMAQAVVALAQKRLEIVKAQVALKLGLPQDVELAKAQLAAAQQAVASSTGNSHNLASQMATMLGRPEDQKIELDRSKPPAAALPTLNEFLGRVMPTHPALRVQQTKVEIARQQYRVDRADIWPTANLINSFTAAQDLAHFNGGHRHARPTLFLSYIAVDIPMFDFGERRAGEKESAEKVLSQQETLSQLRVDLKGAIVATYDDISGIDSSIADREVDYTKASNAASLVRAQRSEGLLDELALVDAELALLNARISLESEQTTKLLKLAELQNLSGGAWRWFQ
jgi:outer membrane protein